MAGAAMSFLVENLSQLLNSNNDLIFGAETELQKLKNEAVLFRAFLEEAAKKPKKEAFWKMEKQIREFAYDAEDTIYSSMIQVKKKYPPRLRKRFSLAEKVRSLREDKVKPMMEKAMMDFAANVQIRGGSGDGEEEESWTLIKKGNEDDLIGLSDEISSVMDYLMQEGNELTVASIVGMPGLGKTTMAWKIFTNHKIQYEFPTRIWINASQNFNQRDAFLHIVKAFTSRDMTSMSDQDLVQIVRGYLEEEKFFLVLDDVWSVKDWEVIRQVLPRSNNTSKVLITSRSMDAVDASSTRYPYRLCFLKDEESWMLLQFTVFGEIDRCPRKLEPIGIDVARRCNGLPLLVVLVGGVLAYQSSMRGLEDAWNHVLEILSMRDRYDTGRTISKVVELSYNNMPEDLKDCFLYVAVFPRDYVVSAWTLTRLWIAEGLIRDRAGRSLEGVAEENLRDLINRNLLIVEKRNCSGEVKTCRVDGFVHDFCTSEAMNRGHNLFKRIQFNGGCFDPPVSAIQKSRHVCIHSHLSEFLAEKIHSTSVRSLLCFYNESFILPPDYVSTIPTTFTLLRVLESKSIRFSRFPMKLSKLIHLKYITLSCENMVVLPEPFSELWNLQTLELDTESPSIRIEANIWGMIQLRHLKTKASIVLAIEGGRGGNAGENLQTLSRLSPENCTKEVFNRIRNLKRLGIRGKLTAFLNDISNRSLDEFNQLQALKLINNEPQSASTSATLPRSNCFPPFLRRLTLSATYLEWSDISVLENIKTLEVLKLKNNAFKGSFWQVENPHGFPNLRLLIIAYADFVHWLASADALPSLTRLVLKKCENLREIPECLAKSLKKVDMEYLCRSAVESARRIKEKQRQKWIELNLGPGCG